MGRRRMKNYNPMAIAESPMTAPDSVERVVAEMRRRAGCLPAVSDWAGVVEEELHDWMKRLQALARVNRASGSHPDALPDGTFSKSTVKRRRVLQQAGGEDVPEKVVAWMNEREAWRSPRAPSEPGTHALVLADDYAALQAEVARLTRESDGYRQSRNAYEEDVVRLQAALREAGRLLRIAACPNEDCEDGAYHAANGRPARCQFCCERDAALNGSQDDA